MELIHWSPRGLQPCGTQEILIKGSCWKEVASDARTCPRQHEKTFEEQESALRSQVKVQALDNPLQSTGLCHPSSGFTLGVPLPVLKVGSPYGYKGVAPPRDRSPQAQTILLMCSLAIKDLEISLIRGWGLSHCEPNLTMRLITQL